MIHGHSHAFCIHPLGIIYKEAQQAEVNSEKNTPLCADCHALWKPSWLDVDWIEMLMCCKIIREYDSRKLSVRATSNRERDTGARNAQRVQQHSTELKRISNLGVL